MDTEQSQVDVNSLIVKLQTKIGELFTTVALLELQITNLKLSHDKELDILRTSHRREIEAFKNSNK